jgi:glutathionyl-hydroquinone reductase
MPTIPTSEKGEFLRPETSFRNFIPSEKFPAENGRYHL